MSHLSLRLLLCGLLTGLLACGADDTPASAAQDTAAATGADETLASTDTEDDAAAATGAATGAAGSNDAAGATAADETAGVQAEEDDSAAAGEQPIADAEGDTPDAVTDGDGAVAEDMDAEEPVGQDPIAEEGADTFAGNFSFFVTSLEIMRELSGSVDGFGGDLGGLDGADEICRKAAETQGAGGKTWHAFLSTSEEDAIDRIGAGPWYDRNGLLVAENLAGLLGTRPMADEAIANNLPNERGEPLNQNGTDDHDVLTGSNAEGRWDNGSTCDDWTSTTSADGGPMMGHSWPRGGGGGGRGGGGGGSHWIESHNAPGCSAGVVIEQLGGAPRGTDCVGCAGGYGGIYCFALEP